MLQFQTWQEPSEPSMSRSCVDGQSAVDVTLFDPHDVPKEELRRWMERAQVKNETTPTWCTHRVVLEFRDVQVLLGVAPEKNSAYIKQKRCSQIGRSESQCRHDFFQDPEGLDGVECSSSLEVSRALERRFLHIMSANCESS